MLPSVTSLTGCSVCDTGTFLAHYLLIIYRYFHRNFQILPVLRETLLALLGQHRAMELRSVLMAVMNMGVRLHLGFCLQSYLELDLSYGVLCVFTQSNESIM